MRKIWWSGVAVSLLAACSSSSSGDSTGDSDGSTDTVEDSLEIFSWLTASGEKEALDALFDQLKSEHPGISVVNAAAAEPDTARDELKKRMLSGDPPDSFQAVGGADLMTWVDQGKMANIDALFSKNKWLDAFPQPLVDLLEKDGHYYAVPLNIERDNNLYYGKALLEKEKLTAPKTLDDFYALCASVKSANAKKSAADQLIPLAMPPAGWVLALVAFETMMPAVNGGDFYLDFMHGKADLTSGELEKLAAEFSKVIDCSNVAADDASPRWDATADLVVAGKATTFVMGDWAKGYFQGATDFEGNARDAWVPGTDFDVVPGLGSDGYFTFNSIVFGLPKGAAHPNAAAAFLGVVGSKDGQVASNSLKGSVPARKDVATDDFDSIVEGAIKDFQAAAAGTNKLLPGYASLTSYDFQVEINPTLLVFAVGGKKARALDPDNVPTDEAAIPAKDVDYLVNKIKANYDLLQ